MLGAHRLVAACLRNTEDAFPAAFFADFQRVALRAFEEIMYPVARDSNVESQSTEFLFDLGRLRYGLASVIACDLDRFRQIAHKEEPAVAARKPVAQ